MNWADLQPLATAFAGLGALAVFALSVWKERHPLRTVERLTTVAASVQSPYVRRLVEDHRDERVAEWVLERRAPPERTLWWWGRLIQLAGVATFAVWVALASSPVSPAWTWAFYLASIATFFLGALVIEKRRARRSEWARQERSWRGIPEAHAAERVHHG